MRTTDSIIQDLEKSRDAQLADGLMVDVRGVEQQITAHKQLARLRAERKEHAKDTARAAELNSQIRYWLTLVDVDVDEKVAEQPAKDSTKTVDERPPAS